MDNKELIRNKLREMVARQADVGDDEMEDHVNLGEYGLDSASAVSMMDELEDIIGTALPPTMFYENPTIDELTEAVDRASRDARD